MKPRDRAALGGAAAGLAAAVSVVLVLALGGGGDDPPEAAPTPSPTAMETAAPSATPAPTAPPRATTSPTPSRPTVTTASPSARTTPRATPVSVTLATGRTITASRAEVSLTLPRTWSGATTENEPAAAARQLYPEDTDRAAKALSFFTGLPSSTVLFGLDVVAAGTGSAFVPNLNLVVDPSLPAAWNLERTADAQAAGLTGGYALTERRTLDLGDVVAVRLTYQVAQPRSVGVVYVVKPGRVTYVLTVSFPALSSTSLRLADGTAATLRLP